MMTTLHFVLILLAFLFFVMAAVDARIPRVNPLAMGLALWMLSILLATPQ